MVFWSSAGPADPLSGGPWLLCGRGTAWCVVSFALSFRHTAEAAQMGFTLLFIRATLTLIWLCICCMCQDQLEGECVGGGGRGGGSGVGGCCTGQTAGFSPLLSSVLLQGSVCFLLCMSVISSTADLLATDAERMSSQLYERPLFEIQKRNTQ